VDNWRQSPEAKKAQKSSDDPTTDGDAGASVHRGDVVWPDNVEDDGRRETAVGNWRQSTEAKKKSRRQTRTLVRSFSEVKWLFPKT